MDLDGSGKGVDTQFFDRNFSADELFAVLVDVALGDGGDQKKHKKKDPDYGAEDYEGDFQRFFHFLQFEWKLQRYEEKLIRWKLLRWVL